MPYGVSFTKAFPITDRNEYWNECCVGGDVVSDQLLPSIRTHYTNIDANQEDWGWFIWLRKDKVKMAIDIFTEDPDKGIFRIHLTSRTKRLFGLGPVADTPELDELRELVLSELKNWGCTNIEVARLDEEYN
jgi:hypothetical protein